MAKQLNAGDVKRGDLPAIYPDQIVVKPEENGRTVQPDITDLIIKILIVPGGARVLEPVGVRPIADKKVQLSYGYGRHAAVTFINKHLMDNVLRKMLDEAGYEDAPLPTEPLRLPCVLSNVNAEEAFVNNIIENRARNNTTAIDDANNIRRLQTQYHKSDAEICRLYSKNGKPMSPAWLTETLKLLQLSSDDQKKVATREWAGSVGIFAAKLDEDVRPVVMQEAKAEAVAESGKDDAPVTMAHAVKAARKTPGALTNKISRKMVEVRSLAERHVGPAKPLHKRRFFEALTKWVDGDLDDDAMDKECNRRFKE